MKKFVSLALLAFIGQAVQAASDEANYLSVEPFYIEPGETVDIYLNLTNEDPICNYQMELYLPEGISITFEEEDGEIYYDIFNTERTNSREPHTYNVNAKANPVKITCTSSKIRTFKGNSGAVTRVSLKADETIAPGVYEVKLENIVLTIKNSDVDFSSYYPSNVIVPIPVGVNNNGVQTLAGAYNEEAIAVLNEALAAKSGINVIDMKEVTSFEGEVNVDANPNTLIYTSSEIGVANEKNVVVGETCENLVLTDGYTFAPIESFTITSGTYNRTLDAGKYGTVVLPFAIDDVTKAAYEFYTLKGLNGNYLQFELVESPEAGVPYLYINKGETAATGFTAVANTESAAISESVSSDAWQMKATYSPISITDTDVLDKTYYISNNTVKNATKSLTINPFRAYITGPSYSEVFTSTTQSIGIRLEGTTEILPVEMVNDEVMIDLNGRVVNCPEKGIYIKNGKKCYIK